MNLQARIDAFPDEVVTTPLSAELKGCRLKEDGGDAKAEVAICCWVSGVTKLFGGGGGCAVP